MSYIPIGECYMADQVKLEDKLYHAIEAQISNTNSWGSATIFGWQEAQWCQLGRKTSTKPCGSPYTLYTVDNSLCVLYLFCAVCIYCVYYTQKSSQYLIYSALCVVFIVQRIVHSVKCAGCSALCAVCSVQCTMFPVQCTLHCGNCAVYSAMCVVWSVNYWEMNDLHSRLWHGLSIIPPHSIAPH